jgi:hypothetical protein
MIWAHFFYMEYLYIIMARLNCRSSHQLHLGIVQHPQYMVHVDYDLDLNSRAHGLKDYIPSGHRPLYDQVVRRNFISQNETHTGAWSYFDDSRACLSAKQPVSEMARLNICNLYDFLDTKGF